MCRSNIHERKVHFPSRNEIEVVGQNVPREISDDYHDLSIQEPRPSSLMAGPPPRVLFLTRPMPPANSRGEWEAACQDSRHNTHPGRKEDIILVNCGSWRRVSRGMGTLQEVKIHLVAEDIPLARVSCSDNRTWGKRERFADRPGF